MGLLDSEVKKLTEVYAINRGAKKHWNSQSLRFVCSTSPKTHQSTVSCGDLGYDSGFVTTVRCSALASLAPAYPSGLQPDLFPRLSSPCVSSGPAHHLSSWIWELYSSSIGGGWILWKCDSIHLSSRQLDSLLGSSFLYFFKCLVKFAFAKLSNYF